MALGAWPRAGTARAAPVDHRRERRPSPPQRGQGATCGAPITGLRAAGSGHGRQPHGGPKNDSGVSTTGDPPADTDITTYGGAGTGTDSDRSTPVGGRHGTATATSRSTATRRPTLDVSTTADPKGGADDHHHRRPGELTRVGGRRRMPRLAALLDPIGVDGSSPVTGTAEHVVVHRGSEALRRPGGPRRGRVVHLRDEPPVHRAPGPPRGPGQDAGYICQAVSSTPLALSRLYGGRSIVLPPPTSTSPPRLPGPGSGGRAGLSGPDQPVPCHPGSGRSPCTTTPHDVLVLQIHGEKEWTLFEGRPCRPPGGSTRRRRRGAAVETFLPRARRRLLRARGPGAPRRRDHRRLAARDPGPALGEHDRRAHRSARAGRGRAPRPAPGAAPGWWRDPAARATASRRWDGLGVLAERTCSTARSTP